MEDVKIVKKIKNNVEERELVGPLEELKRLTLEDFRYLSDDPIVATQKIREKIVLLADESFEKGIQGIKEWKKSEINKIYLSILNDALIKHLSIDDILIKRKEERKTVLSKKEFDAISKLNQNLRF